MILATLCIEDKQYGPSCIPYKTPQGIQVCNIGNKMLNGFPSDSYAPAYVGMVNHQKRSEKE